LKGYWPNLEFSSYQGGGKDSSKMCRWRSENPPSAARQSSSQTGEAISEALAAIPEIEAQLAISKISAA
jgi:hypothetical protein